ncbi:S-layer homology domain-containing protein [Paenibacillus sinensis]|nr:S-layer homology domain-containing protein [Paenibacillus sinensis]
MVFTSYSNVFAAGSSDIAGNWAEQQIKKWMDNGYISGYQNGEFKPNNQITRAELVVLINKSFGFTGQKEVRFSDVTQKDWFYPEIVKASAAGYISGYSDGTFGPNKKVTREEFAVILSNLLKLSASESGSKFADAKDISSWSRGAVGAAYDSGLIKGYSDHTFHPKSAATRAETVVILDRALELKGDSSVAYNTAGVYGPESGTVTVKQNVEIHAPNVTLQNTVIEGNLTFGKEIADGDAFLKNVIVTGSTTVLGGGAHSVHLQNSKLGQVAVNKMDGNIRVVIDGATAIQDLQILSPALIESAQGAAIQTLTIANEAGGSQFINNGTIGALVINASVQVSGSGRIDNAIINAAGISFDQPPAHMELGKDVPSNTVVKIGGKDTTVNPASASPAAAVSGGGGGGGGGGGVPVIPSPAPTALPSPTPVSSPAPTPTATTDTTETHNVEGTIHYSDGAEVKDGVLHLSNESGANFDFQVLNGKFSYDLSAGKYMFSSLEDLTSKESISFYGSFLVESGQPARLTLTVPQKYDGRIAYKDGTSVDDGWVQVRSGNLSKNYNVPVHDGHFNAYLPGGSYFLLGLHLDTGEYIDVNYSFSALNGKTIPASLQIVLPDKYEGTLHNEDGSIISDGYVSISSLSGLYSYFPLVKNGKFTVYLPDDSYRVRSYYNSVSGESISFNYVFKASGGQMNPNPLNVTIPRSNVSGKVTNEDGSVVSAGTLNILYADNSNYVATVKNGDFNLYLPDGPYRVTSYYNSETGLSTYLSEIFHVNNGVPDHTLNITLRTSNVAGTIGYEDGSFIAYGSISVSGKISDGSIGIYSVNVKDGRFSVYLPDGTYRADSLYNFYKHENMQLSYDFTVTGGISSPNPVNIVLKARNVHGIVVNEDGMLADSGVLTVRSKANDASYFLQVNDGEFRQYLPDGEYEVNTYSDQQAQESTELSGSFSVVDGKATPDPLKIVVNSKNVLGTIAYEDGTPATDGSISIRRTDSAHSNYYPKVVNGQFSLYLPDGEYEVYEFKASKYLDSRQFVYSISVKGGISAPNPIKINLKSNNVSGSLVFADGTIPGGGEVWIKSINADPASIKQYYVEIKNGTFNLFLPDGQYTLFQYYDLNQSIWLSHSFSVIDGKSTPSLLKMVITKVSGEVAYEDGTPISSGSIYIRTANNDGSYSFYNADVKDGQFKLNLPDGRHEVYRIYNADQYETTDVSYAFTIMDGKMAPDSLRLVLQNKNVIGTVTREDGTAVRSGGLSIRSTSSNSLIYSPKVINGKFRLNLPDGNYQVFSYYDHDTQETAQLWNTFSVVNGKFDPSPLNITIKNKNVAGSVAYEDGTAAVNGSMVVRSTATGSTYFNIQVGSGQFSLYLPDGEYKISRYLNSATNESAPISYVFSVVNGQSVPASLNVKIMSKNLVGTVAYENGNAVGNGTLAIRGTVANSTYAYFSAEVRNGQFSAYIPDGIFEAYSCTVNSDDFGSIPISYVFSVIDGIMVPAPLDIKIRNNNIVGTVALADGTAARYGRVIIRDTTRGLFYMLRVTDGRIDSYLPEGTYEVTTYMNEEIFVNTPLSYVFSVINGVSSPAVLNIVI